MRRRRNTLVAAAQQEDQPQGVDLCGLQRDDAVRARIVAQVNQEWNDPGAANFDNASMRLITDTDPDRSIVNGGFEQGVEDEFASWNQYGSSESPNIFRDIEPVVTKIDFENTPLMLVNLVAPDGFDQRYILPCLNELESFHSV